MPIEDKPSGSMPSGRRARLLKFVTKESPAHGEYLVFIESSHAIGDYALFAAFSSKLAADEVTTFFNWLAENRRKVEINRDAGTRPAMVGLVHAD